MSTQFQKRRTLASARYDSPLMVELGKSRMAKMRITEYWQNLDLWINFEYSMVIELEISRLDRYDYLVLEEHEISGLAKLEYPMLTELEICKLT